MRVIVLSWEYPPVLEGGLGRHVGKLCERLAAAGVEVHVLTRGGAEGPAQESAGGVTVHRVPALAFPLETEAFVGWVAEMNARMAVLGLDLSERLGFDLVHSHDWLVAQAAREVSRAHGLPWLVTVHATEHGRYDGWIGRRPQSLIHAAERAMVTDADHVITCSEYMAAHVSDAFAVPPERITTVRNGIDPPSPGPAAPEAVSELRARYAEPAERLVLMAGRLAYEKGFHLALEALAPLVTRPGRVRFVVTGRGMAEEELTALASRLGLDRYGSFIGWAGDDLLHSLYRVADIVVVPSLYEPFGLVALEAMASGSVCVVADTGGLREVVPEDESVGVRFRSGDAAALRSVLRRLLADDALRARIGERARVHALQFSWGRSAARTLEVYDALTARVDSL